MTLKQRLDALLKASSETITPAESVRSYREYAVACAEAYRAGLLVARETPPEPQRAPQAGESVETNPDQLNEVSAALRASQDEKRTAE